MLLRAIVTTIVIVASVWSVFGQRRVVPVCPKLADGDKLVGFQIKLIVPMDTVIAQGHDVDYSYWSIAFGEGKMRTELTGMSGFNVGNGEPMRDEVAASRRFERHYWAHNKQRGVDSKGTFKNGKRWRNFGMFGEVIWYFNAPVEAAAYFDRLLETACFID
jgi:hypothetical protein